MPQPQPQPTPEPQPGPEPQPQPQRLLPSEDELRAAFAAASLQQFSFELAAFFQGSRVISRSRAYDIVECALLCAKTNMCEVYSWCPFQSAAG